MPTIKISGMRCGHCTAAVAKALGAIDGLANINVDLEKNEASYTESKEVKIEVVKEAIARIGFEVV